MLRLLTFVVCIAAIQGRIFNKTVFENGDYQRPGAIKVDGAYYVATKMLKETQTDKLAVHESTDLINWKFAGYIFDNNNYPMWSSRSSPYDGAKIHKIGINYFVFFNAYYDVTKQGSIGVASAPHPLGPYTATDRPLVTDSVKYSTYPTIANDNGNYYLIWESTDGIKGRQLNLNGVSFASNETFDLISSDLDWEKNYVTAPWYIQKGDFHYIMYTGGEFCKSLSIGVARSRNVLGPYKKLANPILVSNSNLRDPAYNSMVTDLDDQSDVIVYQTYSASAGCGTDRFISLASVGWNANNWPYVYDN